MSSTSSKSQGSAPSESESDSNSTTPSLLSHIQFEHLAAGVTGGVVSSLILHPLDLIKVRFQVNEGPSNTQTKRPSYNGITHAFRTILKSDGWRGLYRGVTPNVTGAGLSWGLYFFFYNGIKKWMQEGDTNVNLGAGNHMLIASFSGLFTLSLTNPLWVSKTRMCLQYDTGHSRPAGMFETLGKIYKLEGYRGLYKGYLPGLFGISHGALQFMAYEELKTKYNSYRNQPLDTRLTSVEYLMFAAISKMFAATLTYPYQVVRSRLQDQHRHYDGVMDVVRQIWRHEGLGAYYKGLTPSLVRVTPACAITFVVYESIISFCHDLKKSKLEKGKQQKELQA